MKGKSMQNDNEDIFYIIFFITVWWTAESRENSPDKMIFFWNTLIITIPEIVTDRIKNVSVLEHCNKI